MKPAGNKETWEDVWLKTTCYGCPAATCGMIAHRVNGVVVKVDGDPDNPFSMGRLCAKGQAQIMMAYNSRRVTRPLKRTNPEKGIGVDPRWVEISYDEAVRISAEKIRQCHDTDPAGLVLSTSDFTTLTWFTAALLGSFGSPNHASGGKMFCGNNVHPVLQQMFGSFHITPDLHYGNYLILLGSNKGAMSNWAAVSSTIKMADARRRGLKVVVVDPWCSNSAAIADEWVPIRPGTDGAFVLSMINVLVNELGLYDVEFLRKLSNGPYLVRAGDGRYLRDHASGKPLLWDLSDQRAKCYDDATLSEPAMEGRFTVDGVACAPGFQLLKEHLAHYSPEHAEEITTVPAATIRRLAKEFGTAAQIGSTIEIDGETLPLRPASAHWYKGVSQHARSYEQGLAIALLNAVVGAIDVPGGMLSDAVYLHHPEYSAHSAWLGKGPALREVDGILTAADIATYGGMFPSQYPTKTVSRPAGMAPSSLAPVGLNMWVAAKVNVLHPEEFNNQVPHNPQVYIQCVANDIVNEGNPKAQAEWHKRFGFQLSLVPIVDETAEFADIVIPTQTQLERLDMGANNIPDTIGSTVTGDYCINLRQPVVDNGYKHFVDIWTDIIEQVGLLPEFNAAVNKHLELEGDNRLASDRKYDNRELNDRWIRSMTGDDKSLDDIAVDSHIKWKKSVKEMYPRPFFDARIPIYFEHFLEAKERLEKVVSEMGLDWDTSRYKPLPDWYPGPGHADRGSPFDLFGVAYKWPFMTGTFSNFNPWLNELGRMHPYVGKIVLNRKTAQEKGIRDGDRVRVENTRGNRVEGQVMLSECIHPECVGMDHAGGNWAKSLPNRNTGVHYGTLLSYDRKNIDHMNGAFEASPKLRVSRIG